jgi:hypothetical protein
MGISSATEDRMRSKNGFTRLELVATFAALALIGLVALPLLAANRSDSDRAGCFNNLRGIGRAVETWGADRDGVPPWITFVSRGGTRPDSGFKAGVAWFEFTALSNELVTPRLLTCPADAGVKVASEFSTDGTRGYMATGFRALATSYFINMDNLGRVPLMAVTGDRNLRADGITSCSQGVNNADFINLNVSIAELWTNAVHGVPGHFLRSDGSVALMTSAAILADYSRLIDDNGNVHLLRAR